MAGTGNFNAFVLEKAGDEISGAIKELTVDSLPEGDVTVAISYSGLNFKDGMIIGGIGGLVRDYPHVPGIDFAGVVEESGSPDFKPGDQVILTGWRVGEVHWGGYAQRARVKSEWLVPMPAGLDPRGAMAIGTAGFTAMLAVKDLERVGVAPDQGEIVVTGAAGGVGSVAVAILANLGYDVVASTGRPQNESYLLGLGAKRIIARAELEAPLERPLGRETWAGAVDTVGGSTIASLLATMKNRGAVSATGLVGGRDINSSIMPFLIRGVKLMGIDSVLCPAGERRAAWERVARDLPLDKLETTINTAGLADLPALGKEILQGKVRGRTIVDVNA